jgi:hypothetical protein
MKSLVVMFFGNLFELAEIDKASELVEVKHVLALAVFTEERHVFAEVHILEVISDKTSVAALDALAEFQ